MDKDIARLDLLLEMSHQIEIALAAARYIDAVHGEMGVDGPSVTRPYLKSRQQLELALAGHITLAMTDDELKARLAAVRRQVRAVAREARLLRALFKVGCFLAGDPRHARTQRTSAAYVSPAVLMAASLAIAALWLTGLR